MEGKAAVCTGEKGLQRVPLGKPQGRPGERRGKKRGDRREGNKTGFVYYLSSFQKIPEAKIQHGPSSCKLVEHLAGKTFPAPPQHRGHFLILWESC